MQVHKIIIYDGVCLLCNAFVRFIIKHDKSDIFRFETLQSGVVSNDKKGLVSVLLLENDKVYNKSSAVIRILSSLSALWKITFIFLIIPKFFRDYIYSKLAQNRYKLFGKAESCIIPDDSIKHKFN